MNFRDLKDKIWFQNSVAGAIVVIFSGVALTGASFALGVLSHIASNIFMKGWNVL